MRGSCLCGAVEYEVRGPLRPVINCHCRQCRKWSGHFVAATAARSSDMTIVDPDAALRWYRASESARRGFCGRCGSGLFWQKDGADYTAISAGGLDGATGLETAAELYTDHRGDYYDLADPRIPKYPESGHAVRIPVA